MSDYHGHDSGVTVTDVQVASSGPSGSILTGGAKGIYDAMMLLPAFQAGAIYAGAALTGIVGGFVGIKYGDGIFANAGYYASQSFNGLCGVTSGGLIGWGLGDVGTNIVMGTFNFFRSSAGMVVKIGNGITWAATLGRRKGAENLAHAISAGKFSFKKAPAIVATIGAVAGGYSFIENGNPFIQPVLDLGNFALHKVGLAQNTTGPQKHFASRYAPFDSSKNEEQVLSVPGLPANKRVVLRDNFPLKAA